MKKNSNNNPFLTFEKEKGVKNVKSEKKEFKEINKSEILASLRNSTLVFVKSGKEIKDQINNFIIPSLTDIKEEIKGLLDAYLAKVDIKPTAPCWRCVALTEEEFPYKLYTWEELNWTEKSFGDIFAEFGQDDEEGI